jgi:hypothetical protein
LLVCFLVFAGSVYFCARSSAYANGTAPYADDGATLTYTDTALADPCSTDSDADRDSAHTNAVASNGVEQLRF